MMIKVCGMRDAQNIREVDALGVDMIGFIFWPGSKRYCAEKPAYLPKANRVGVFVNAAISEIVEKVREYELYIVQLHGDEDLAYVSKLHKELDSANVKRPIVIRAIQVSSRSQVIKANMWDGFVDGILFETPTNGYGGSGESFDWSLLSSYRGKAPFFLTGGIGPQSLEALKEFSHPRWAGVDLNSRFEIEPGLKNVALLKPFIEELRSVHLKGDETEYK